MINDFLDFKNDMKNTKTKLSNTILAKIIKDYSFVHISSLLNYNDNQNIFHHFAESKIIIVNISDELNPIKEEQYFFVGFKKTIIMIEYSQLNFLYPLLSSRKELYICFLSNSQHFFDQNIKIHYNLSETISKFEDEDISLFEKKFFCYPINKIWKIIYPCISTYLIKQSYLDLNENRIEKFFHSEKKFEQNKKIEFIKENEYIELSKTGIGSVFSVDIIYHIDKQSLLAIKKPHQCDSEIPKLIERECNNYLKIKHPFFPKFYGLVKHKDYLVIEYINGETLNNINQLNLSDEDKITIIFELIVIIEYLHHHNFIFRDLKPNNIMIDHNKTVVLIDFDRMIYKNSNFNDQNHTKIFFHDFAAPEMNSNNFSFECDIYSLGKMILYIMNNQLQRFPDIQKIYNKCIDLNPGNRPKLKELIIDFYISFHSKIKIDHFFKLFEDYYNKIYDQNIINLMKNIENEPNNPEYLNKIGGYYLSNQYIKQDFQKGFHYIILAANQNHPIALYNLAMAYFMGDFYEKNISKAIYYLKLSSNQNYSDSQHLLGFLYFEGYHVPYDIEKAIHYFTLAANQNHPISQYNLGVIFSSNNYVNCDINKSIKYYTLSSNQNYCYSQYNLALIYHEGLHVKRDIEKAIYYYKLAAEQDLEVAQYNLGILYYDDKYIKKDIHKAIQYFTLCANKNDPKSKFFLGLIYYEGEFVSKNIQKALKYFNSAANQQLCDALYILGFIYYEGKEVKRDINKSIYYFDLSSNQNNPTSQFLLGLIYFKGDFIQKNIQKSLYYFQKSANNRYPHALFIVGFFYHEGKYINYDIEKSIHFYKEASNLNNKSAQNNLGIIYKNGISGKIQKNIHIAIEYFKEAINIDNDALSKYNLASLYMYEKSDSEEDINTSIQYLIELSQINFNPSKELLSTLLVKKFGKNLNKIKDEINKIDSKLADIICQIIIDHNLLIDFVFNDSYEILRKIDLLYDYDQNIIASKDLVNNHFSINQFIQKSKLSPDFYDGFGIEI